MIISKKDIIENPELVDEISNKIKDGCVIAFPTETVYGFGAGYKSTKAKGKICAIKSRPIEKEMAFYVYDINHIMDKGFILPEYFEDFAHEFLPGPCTIILEKSNGQTQGFRFAKSDILNEILAKYGEDFIGTSANISGQAPCTKAKEIAGIFGDVIEVIVEDDAIITHKPSTVIGLFHNEVVIMRKGNQYNEIISFFEKKSIKYRVRKNILAVCTGNTCRSPMVEGWLKNVARELKKETEFNITSCGIYAPVNESPSRHAIAVMRKRGIDIENYKSNPLSEDSLKSADKIIVMTKDHEMALRTMITGIENKICVLDIPDPIGMGAVEYEKTFNEIVKRIEEKKQWIFE